MHNSLHKSLCRDCARLSLVALCVLSMTKSSAAGWFTHGCAARDLQILMLIEDRESSNTVAAEKLDAAMLSMLEARIVCHEGHVVDALNIYDAIAQSITPDARLPPRR